MLMNSLRQATSGRSYQTSHAVADSFREGHFAELDR
jgi:hypothetical protein